MTSGGRLEVAWLAPYARIRLLASTVVLAALTAVASLAQAFDPERTFTPGAFAFSLGSGGGEQASFSARSRKPLVTAEPRLRGQYGRAWCLLLLPMSKGAGREPDGAERRKSDVVADDKTGARAVPGAPTTAKRGSARFFRT